MNVIALEKYRIMWHLCSRMIFKQNISQKVTQKVYFFQNLLLSIVYICTFSGSQMLVEHIHSDGYSAKIPV